MIVNPTVHLYNYLNLIIVISAIGWSKMLEYWQRHQPLINRIIFFAAFPLLIFVNSSFVFNKSLTENIYSKNKLKTAAYLVRTETSACEKIYTDIEGYVARIYFGRGYTNDLNKTKTVILEKDLYEDQSLVRKFNKEYASFKNFMPYLKCNE